MISRQRRISQSITRAVLEPVRARSSSLLLRILAFFSLLQAWLRRHKADTFAQLRQEVWRVDEEEYKDSFAEAHGSKGGLDPAGDLGFSGSVFFSTPDGKFLIKSLNRHFEYDHFEADMLRPYVAHMRANAASSLLVRIMDYLDVRQQCVGTLLGLTPSRYIVMENLLGGRAADPVRQGEWETYDLKPEDYFFPERDIADGVLTSDAVKDRLIDKFDDKIRITRDEYENFRQIMESDTALLEACNCVDYSLFLVRYPSDMTKCDPVRSNRNEWRTGVKSRDGKWRYRVVLLDFFFAKHRLQPMLLTGLINIFNVFGRKGPMTITTTPTEYRTRFLRMIDALIEAE